MLANFAGLDLARLLSQRAAERRDHPFLVWAPFEAPAVAWSYARFADAAARIAGGLARRGVRSGDRVLVHLENCPETLLVRFACARLGAVCVATNPMLAQAELAARLEASGAALAVTQARYAPLFSRSALRALLVVASDGSAPAADEAFDALLADDPAPPRHADPGAIASILYTTGTTAVPKGVLWTHANALWAARLGALQQAIRPQDVYHVFLPLFHVVGLGWSVLPALWSGATVLLQSRFSASRYWDAACQHRATLGSQVLFTSRALAQQPVPEHCFRQWTDALSRADHERHFRLRIVGGWGMTEVLAQAIVGDPWGEQRSGAIGRPSCGYRLHIDDDSGQPVEPGGTGHLLVGGERGVSLFAGYDGDEAATRAAFDARGLFRTGDRVTLHEDGWIEFADRVKDVIKVGGEGVSAAEIERAVLAVRGVQEVAVVARSDAAWGEVAVAFVVASAPVPPTLAEDIVAHCQRVLAKFKVPREVILLPELPKVGFGKIAKARLRERLTDPSTQTGDAA